MATSPTYSTDNQYIKYRIITNEDNISIPNNTSRVRVRVQAWRTNNYTTKGSGTCYCTINGTKYSQKITSSQEISYNSYTVLFDKYVTIKHNNDGNKTISVSSYIKHDRFDSSSHGFNVTLSTIPRAAVITNAPDFTDEDNPTIEYDNPAGDVVTSIQAAISSDGETALVAYRDLDLAQNIYTFNLTATERRELLDINAYTKNITVYFLIKTVLAGNTYVNAYQRTMTVVNADPLIVNPTYEDISDATLYITQNNQQIIQDHSELQFHFGELRSTKRGFLNGLTITIDGVTVTEPVTSSTPDVTVYFGFIHSSSNVTAVIKLYDTRGDVTTLEMPITVLSWSPPSAIITCARKNNFYPDTVLTVDGSISSLDNKNTMTIRYRYREYGATSWSAFKTIQDNTPENINSPDGLDNTKEYEIQVRVIDQIQTTVYNLSVARGVPIIMFDKLLNSVGVNCLPTDPNVLEVSGSINATGTINATGDISTAGDLYVGNIQAAGDVGISQDLTVYGGININGIPLDPFMSANERVVGSWIDGSEIYEKTVTLNNVILLAPNAWTLVATLTDDIKPIDIVVYRDTSSGSVVSRSVLAEYVSSTKELNIMSTRSSNMDIDSYTIRYIKTS